MNLNTFLAETDTPPSDLVADILPPRRALRARARPTALDVGERREVKFGVRRFIAALIFSRRAHFL